MSYGRLKRFLMEGIMEIDEEKLKRIYASWGTEDLIKAVTVDKTKYEPYAIVIMNKELEGEMLKKTIL